MGIRKTTDHLLFVTLALLLVASALSAQETAEKPEEKKKPAWQNKLELSYVTPSGNTENDTFASRLDSKFDRSGNRLFLNARLIVQNSSGRETANQFRANGRYERKFGNRLFALLETEFIRDAFSGYEYRWSAGPGLGYDVIADGRYLLKVYGAAVYYYDKFEAGEMDIDDYLSMQATADASAKLQDNLEIANDFDFTISTQDEDNYFINNEVSARVRINTGLAVGLSYIARYENRPATPALEKLNTTFLTSLVLSF